jgi:hypothetical protein
VTCSLARRCSFPPCVADRLRSARRCPRARMFICDVLEISSSRTRLARPRAERSSAIVFRRTRATHRPGWDGRAAKTGKDLIDAFSMLFINVRRQERHAVHPPPARTRCRAQIKSGPKRPLPQSRLRRALLQVDEVRTNVTGDANTFVAKRAHRAPSPSRQRQHHRRLHASSAKPLRGSVARRLAFAIRSSWSCRALRTT